MFKNNLRSTITLLAMAAALGAEAQPFPGGRGPMPFDALDRDGDGYISAQEFAQHREERMAARAAQGRLMRNAGNAPRFEDWDEDSDGRLTQTELANGQQARCAERVANGLPCWRNP